MVLAEYNNNTTQMPYDYALYCILGAVEVNIAIVSGKKYQASFSVLMLLIKFTACCPLLRPIFRRKFSTEYSRSDGQITK